MQVDIVNNTAQNILGQTQKIITLPENVKPSNQFKTKVMSLMHNITDILLTGINKTFSGMKTVGRGIGAAGGVIGTAGKTVFGVIGKILPFAKGALMTLGPIGIGIALTLPLFMEGISFFRNVLLPKVFGGKNNVPSSLRDTVSGLMVKLVTGTIDTVINFIKNIPKYVRVTAKIGGEILGGIKDAIIEIFKWGWNAIKRTFTGRSIAEATTIQTAASEVAAVREQQEEQANFYQNMIEQAEEQGKRMTMIAEYFKGGAFKTDIMELAQSVGKAVRSAFDVLVGIFDFAKGQFGGFITSMGSTLGAFLSGLMGADKAAGFLSDITQIAREKGYGTLAGILGRTRESVLDLANRSAQTQVSAANTFSESVGVFKESVDTLAYTINYRGLASIGAPNVINEPRIIKRNVEQINTIKSLATIGVAETFEAPEMSRAATVAKEQLKADITRQQLLRLYFGSQRITSNYGMRVHPITGKVSQHAGIDIGVKTGTPIYTPLAGKVSKVGWMNGYGNTVIIDHPQENVSTLYAHLSRTLVKSGQMVYPGYKIALSGSTGRSTDPHLHFEVRKLGSTATLNPLPFIDSILTKYLPDVNLADAQLKERAVSLNLVKPVKAQVDTLQSLQSKDVITQVSTVGLGTSQAQQQNNKQQPVGNNIVIVNSPTTNSSSVTSNNNQTKDDDQNTTFSLLVPPILAHDLGL
jgi:murein DD-endopeptidase MepM/ murein hydrolase activator NlpD